MAKSPLYSRRYGQQLVDNKFKNIVANIIEVDCDEIEEGDKNDNLQSNPPVQREYNKILMTEVDCFFNRIFRRKTKNHDIE